MSDNLTVATPIASQAGSVLITRLSETQCRGKCGGGDRMRNLQLERSVAVCTERKGLAETGPLRFAEVMQVGHATRRGVRGESAAYAPCSD